MSEWKLIYREWSPERQPKREALCTLGNGFFATRGAAEESRAGGPHYPGTYLAGGYNRLQSEIAGRVIENEDLVNWPNWLCLTFRNEGGRWFDLADVDLKEFRQELDLERGLLERHLLFRDRDGRETSLVSRRIVHMGEPNLAAIEWTLTPENWSGRIEVRSALDGTVENTGVARYRDLSSRHLEFLSSGPVGEEGIHLCVQTNQSHIRMAQAARTRVFRDGERVATARRTFEERALISQTLAIECEEQRPVRVEKIVAVHTSRDDAISEACLAARTLIGRAGSFEDHLASHARAWARLWHRCDIRLGRDPHEQLILRLHVFHLLQTVSIHTIDLDVGVPSRGLHGEAYRGHIFWDELFIFPFLNLRIPEVTRALLIYRYRRLPEARRAAREAGHRGAMFPWQSGSDGREESQVIHLNPRSGRWLPDHTSLQRHVNAAIAHSVWLYYQTTADTEFLSFYGAEMILSIARFWASIATFNSERDRYEIRGVVGPDEYHTDYPDSEEPGLNNNAYTNVMAAWVLRCAQWVLDVLAEDRRAELLEDLEIGDDELARWDEISRKMFVPFHGDGIISQFEGYERLKEFDWKTHREKHGPAMRLDRILEAEGDTPNRYKAAKQADVLMLFYLFSADELRGLFERMGHRFDPGMIPRNVEYYSKRTSHGSTLSRIVHSWVLARSDRERSWRSFEEALKSDYEDVQGGTTPEGIHLGAMAGTVDLVQRCYTGLEIRDDVLWLNPCLAEELPDVRLRLRYRGHWLSLHVTQSSLTVSFERGWSKAAKVGFRGTVHTFEPGETKCFDLRTTTAATKATQRR